MNEKLNIPYFTEAVPCDYIQEYNNRYVPESSMTVFDLFFPVQLRPVYWADTELNDSGFPLYHNHCPRHYAVVRIDWREVFSVVTDKYDLITNEQAYKLGIDVSKHFFGTDEKGLDSHIDDVSHNFAACEFSIFRKIEDGQPLLLDGWRAIIRIANSYNKTKQLSFTAGFEYKRAAILFPDINIVLKDAHSIPFDKVHEELFDLLLKSERGTKIHEMEEKFESLLRALQNVPMSREDMLRLFCKVFLKTIKKSDYPNYFVTLAEINHFISNHSGKLGRNAHALLHVFAEYVSKHSDSRIRDLNMSQLALGKWATEFVHETSDPDFSFYNYFGKDVSDLVSAYLSIHK